jgi:hypothetical protein
LQVQTTSSRFLSWCSNDSRVRACFHEVVVKGFCASTFPSRGRRSFDRRIAARAAELDERHRVIVFENARGTECA